MSKKINPKPFACKKLEQNEVQYVGNILMFSSFLINFRTTENIATVAGKIPNIPKPMTEKSIQSTLI